MSSSLEALIAQLPGLRRYARLLVGDAGRADDLVQDTAERAIRALGRWPAEAGRLRPWLLSVMHNLFVDQIRARTAHPVSATVDDEVLEQVPSARDEAGAAQTRIDLIRALQRLSPAHRAVLLLVCVEDCPYEEAASILGVPVGTVMSRLSRARAQLRDVMDGVERGPAPLRRVK